MAGETKAKVPGGQIVMVLALIVITGLVIYSNTLNVPFVFDDVHAIVDDESRRTLDLSWQNWLGNRSIPNLTLDLNYYWHELWLPGYHAFNIGIHIATAATVCGMAFILAGLLLPQVPVRVGKWWVDDRVFVGGVAGVFFLVHPVQTQAITYIIQRLAAIATLFYLQAIVWFLMYRMSRSRWRFLWAFLSIFSGIAAMHSKEIAFTLPVVITVLEFTIWPPAGNARALIKETTIKTLKLLPWLMLMLIIPLYLFEVHELFLRPSGVPEQSLNRTLQDRVDLGKIGNITTETQGMDRRLYLKTQFGVIMRYIRLIIWPAGQNIDHDVAWAGSIRAGRLLVPLLVEVVLFGGAIAMAMRGWKMVGLGVLIFFITLAVESSIIPIRDAMFEHRLYLPMAGLALTASALTFQLYRWLSQKGYRGRWGRAAMISAVAIYFIVLAGATWQRNSVWADELSLWRDAVEKSPNKARPKNNLGKALLERRMFEEAKDQYLKEIALDPKSVSGHNNLGSIYGLQGDYAKALEEVNMALSINPRHDSSYNNLGNIQMLQGKWDESERAYETSIEINPKDAGVWANLGDLRLKKEEYGEAEEAFRRAITLHDEKGEWHSKLGGILGKRQEYGEAERELKKAIEIDPDLSGAYANLGNVFKEQEKWEEALRAYVSALRLQPNDKEVVNSLGEVLLALGKEDQAREAWTAVLKADPEHERAKENMGKL